MNDAKIYAMQRTRTPYKDQATRKWVVRWEENGKWFSESFDMDADAWYFYYKKFNAITAQYKPKGKEK